MVRGALALGAVSVIVGLVAVAAAAITRRAASAAWGAAGIIVASAVLFIVLGGYQCFNVTALVFPF